MFGVKEDLDTIVRGIKISRDIYRQKPFADMLEDGDHAGAEGAERR